MIMDIDKDTLHRTTDCTKDFDCLNNKSCICCKVKQCISNVLFIKCPEENRCFYKLPFAQENICTCPTRKEIFNKHGV